jgi:outer membrane lipoprotein SlyB
LLFHARWGTLEGKEAVNDSLRHAGARRVMKKQQKPDNKIHIRKKVAGGTTGAVLGAVVGGPVGALVGGVIGSVIGGAAETGKLNDLTRKAQATNETRAVNKGKVQTVRKKARKSTKRVARKTTARARGMTPKVRRSAQRRR